MSSLEKRDLKTDFKKTGHVFREGKMIKVKNRKWGLVLAGGGGKGAYQVGVLKAMEELGLLDEVVAVAGSSIGGLNAAMLAQGKVSVMEQIWSELTPKEVLTSAKGSTAAMEQLEEIFGELSEFLAFDDMDKYLNGSDGMGVCTRDGMEKIIDNKISFDKIRNYDKKLFATVTKIEAGNHVAQYELLNDKDDERMNQLLLATSALPGVYDAVVIDGTRFWDGGVADNVPIKPLRDLGLKNFIVLRHTAGDVKLQKLSDTEENIIEIVPSHTLGDFLTGTIDFSHDSIMYRMALGYYDGLTIFNEMERVQKGTPSEYLDFKMLMMENHEKAKGQQRRSLLEDSVSQHMADFSKYENYYNH